VHNRHNKHVTYTGGHGHPHHHQGFHPGSAPHHHHGGHGFCHACCHPVDQCCCHHRECRKEAKELLVKPTLGQDGIKDDAIGRATFARVSSMAKPQAISKAKAGDDAGPAEASPRILAMSAADLRQASVGIGTAFIGGGCCVHLSIEYTPSTPTTAGVVGVLVDDSEGTVLAWMKQVQPGEGYQVKEGIVTTKPGADLTVVVLNLTARVRWCEVFSC